jgi:ribose transport system substrate-binding protein
VKTLNHLAGGRRRTTVAVAAAAGCLTLVSACGSAAQPADGSGSGSGSGDSGGGKTVVFSPLGLQIPAMKQLSEGVQAYGKSKGYAVQVQDPKLDPQKQVTDLQTAIGSGKANGVWAIMVAPEAAASLLKAAQAKGVPMVVNGTPEAYGYSGMVPGVSFSTIDHEAQGKAAGTELGNCINDKLGGNAKVLFEQSAAGTAGKKEYEGAVKKYLAETAPNAEIVANTVVSDRQTAQTDVGNALQGNPDIKAVFGQNDEGALGAIGAFKAAGKKLDCVTETGGNDEALAAAKSGDIYAVVALQFQDDMAQSFDKLTEMMKDPKAKGVQLVTPQKVVKAES